MHAPSTYCLILLKIYYFESWLVAQKTTWLDFLGVNRNNCKMALYPLLYSKVNEVEATQKWSQNILISTRWWAEV